MPATPSGKQTQVDVESLWAKNDELPIQREATPQSNMEDLDILLWSPHVHIQVYPATHTQIYIHTQKHTPTNTKEVQVPS